jgi:DNA-binding FadR family transcriptional regulator
MTSSEEKLDVLENTVKEMMQNISRKEELVFEDHMFH